MSVEILSPRSDVIFKLFFSDERNIGLLTDFLKAVLDIPADEYDEVSITDPHLLREHPGDKLGILDVKLKTKTGKIINIEIQVSPMQAMKERVVYYDAKLIAEQLGKNDDYENVKRVISVIITDFTMITNSPSYHHRFVLYDPVNKVEFTNALEINTLELPKLPSDSDGTMRWNWMKFLDARTEEELNMIAETSPQVKQAVVRLIELSADEKARALYEAREKERRDNRAREKGASREAVRQREFEMAKSMMADGEPVEKITRYTGLSRDEVESLRN